MPIENIQTPKAPAGWRPSPDQVNVIRGDARLQRMTPDEQYFYFNKKPIQSQVQVQRGSAQPPAQPANHLNGGLAGVFDYIRRSMGGK